MKFPTAKKIRESMKQSNVETMKLAKENFIEQKEKFLNAITISSNQGFFECICHLLYPSEFSCKYIKEVYQEEYKRIAISFFTSLGYKIFFFSPSAVEPTAWARMIINWRDEE